MRDRQYEIQNMIEQDTRAALDAIKNQYDQELETLKPSDPTVTAKHNKAIQKAINARNAYAAALDEARKSGLKVNINEPMVISADFFKPDQPKDESWKAEPTKRKLELEQRVRLEYKRAQIVLLAGTRKQVFEMLNVYGDNVMAIASNRKQLTAGTPPAVAPAPNEDADIVVDMDAPRKPSRRKRHANSQEA